jgi:hypothetical protein
MHCLAYSLMISFLGAMQILCSHATVTKSNKSPNLCLSLEILVIISFLTTHCSKGWDYRSIARKLSGRRFYIVFYVIYVVRNLPPRLIEIDIENPVIRHASSAAAVAPVDSLHVAMLQLMSFNLIG